MLRRLAIVLVNILVFCAFAEAVSLVVYYYQTGHLFYLHDRTSQSFAYSERRQLTGDGLHPYFGPTHKTGIPFDIPQDLRDAASAGTPSLATNNFGFVSAHDYPYVKSQSNEFIVGIFGGSVGLWFCELGANQLVEDLKRHEFFRNRQLVPLCFSHEGYKQPQQLLVLSYFLSIGQQFDLAINIDGFNEVALGSLNDRHGLDISMPSVMHLEPLVNLVDQATLTPDKIRSLAEIGRLKERLADLDARLRRNRLASVHVVLARYRDKTSHDYEGEVAAFANLPSNPATESVIRATPRVKARTGAAVFEDIVANWVASSTLMNALLASRGAAYIHVLQPNQYFTTRRFGDAEARIAFNNASPFKEGAENGYPVLVGESGAGALRRNGVAFVSAVHVFDGERERVYLDDCCHYTRRGNEVLADFIAASILHARGPWSATTE